MDKYIKFSEVLEYLRNRCDEARKCGHEETYFDLLTIIDGLKNVETVPASALGKDTNVPAKDDAIPVDYLYSRISRLRQYQTYAGDFGADFLEAVIKDYNKEAHND